MGIKSILSDGKLAKIELVFFCLLLVFNLVNIWSVDIYATLDGPAHLFNASLLNFYGKSELLKEYYVHNAFYLPNYLPHFILKNLLLFFEPFAAEKIFLSFIVIFIPISFRYAVSLISGSINNLSFLIFTLVFSSLFNVGFFNFSFAFIFFNCQLILLHFLLNSANKIWISILFVCNSVILFYSHPFVFCCMYYCYLLNSCCSFTF